MVKDFTGKTVLVTGSSTGFGAAIVIKFAELGADVIITGLPSDEKEINDVRDKCQQIDAKKKILTFMGDYTNDDVILDLIEKSIKFFGRLDVLVNCAGIGSNCPILEDDAISKYDKLIAINTRAPFVFSHFAAPHLIETKGSIVNIASILGTKPSCGNAHYSMSKSSIIMMTQCLAIELGPFKVRVNSVSPGLSKTRILNRMNMDEATIDSMYESETKASPLGRLVQPNDVANAVIFLASDEAEIITGVNLNVDGGGLWTSTL